MEQIYNPTDNEVEFDLYLKILREINNFFYCIPLTFTNFSIKNIKKIS